MARAGDGNRTHVVCLEGRYSTIELHPRQHLRPFRRRNPIVEGWRRHKLRRRAVESPGWRQETVGGVELLDVKNVPKKSRNERGWVEQDSNLRRQCHQIYSLAPLATWVSTRFRSIHHDAPSGSSRLVIRRPKPEAQPGRPELAVRVELTTVGLQNRCSAD
jgi:hypothetical protein